MLVSRGPLQEHDLATKRLLPGQFDILTILVVTTAIAVTCALLRSPLRLDTKILAVSVAWSFFLVWALWYHEGLRTHFPTILAPVPWAMSLSIGVYLLYSVLTSSRGGLTLSMLALGVIALMLALGVIAFSGAMLFWKISTMYKTISGRGQQTVPVQSSGSVAASSAKLNLSRLALIYASTFLLLFLSRFWIKYSVWGHYEISSSEVAMGSLLLSVVTMCVVFEVIQRRFNGR